MPQWRSAPGSLWVIPIAAHKHQANRNWPCMREQKIKFMRTKRTAAKGGSDALQWAGRAMPTSRKPCTAVQMIAAEVKKAHAAHRKHAADACRDFLHHLAVPLIVLGCVPFYRQICRHACLLSSVASSVRTYASSCAEPLMLNCARRMRTNLTSSLMLMPTPAMLTAHAARVFWGKFKFAFL